jgi:bifunctional non-homologous end joining protein LigD
VFDILELEGRDLRRLPLIERKKVLRALIEASDVAPRIRLSDHVVGNGPAFFEHAGRLGAEGIVSKRAASPYHAGRGRDWLKIKCIKRQEFVIGGYTDPSGKRARLGALLIGVYEGGKLRYAGRVGTGFGDKLLDELAAKLSPIERATPAFADPPRGADARGVHWVEPKLVGEVAFTEWTDQGLIRHPSFQGLRLDKAPRDVKRETPESKPAAKAKAARKRANPKKP